MPGSPMGLIRLFGSDDNGCGCWTLRCILPHFMKFVLLSVRLKKSRISATGRIGLSIDSGLNRTKITRRQLLRTAGASGMLALGAPAATLAAGLQNQQQAPPGEPGQEPKTEAEAAQRFKQGPGVFINRPLTQISKEADALLDDLEGRGCDFF